MSEFLGSEYMTYVLTLAISRDAYPEEAESVLRCSSKRQVAGDYKQRSYGGSPLLLDQF